MRKNMVTMLLALTMVVMLFPSCGKAQSNSDETGSVATSSESEINEVAENIVESIENLESGENLVSAGNSVPTESPKPTEKPVGVEAPKETEEPIETEKPVETARPTEKPVEVAKPTEAPKPTEEPVVVETAKPTEAPVVVEVAKPTEAPKPVEVPKATEAPVVVETPKPTEAPKAEVHEHSYVTSVIREATCTEEGLKRTYCSECGAVKSEESIPAKGHSFETYTWVEAGCVRDGYASDYCTVCGYTPEGYSIPATGHVLAQRVVRRAENCLDSTVIEGYCSVCGADMPEGDQYLDDGSHEYEIVTDTVWSDEAKDFVEIQVECCKYCGKSK